MFINSVGVKNSSSGKRKMKEIASEPTPADSANPTDLFNIQTLNPTSHGQSSQVQRILNNASSANPNDLFNIQTHQYPTSHGQSSQVQRILNNASSANLNDLFNIQTHQNPTSHGQSSQVQRILNTASSANPTDLFNQTPNPTSHGQSSQVQRILNTAAPVKPFSFTSLLNAVDQEDDDPNYLSYHTEQINRIIRFHGENLKHKLTGVLENNHREAEERAAKKLKEKELELHASLTKNAELDMLVENYKAKAERMQIRVRRLERTVVSLRSSLQEVTAARGYAESAEEDAESSFVDPDKVEPVRLDCRACENEVAKMMLWPCRHVCVCRRCNDTTVNCPVCGEVKTTSVEVCFPPN